MANQRILATEEMVGYGHATKADTLNRLTMVEHSEAGVHGAVARASMGTAPLVLGSDADGDMYYRASGALARLEKGTALYHMRVNSAGIAPEWAANTAIQGDAMPGRVLRISSILIEDGTDAAHIKATMLNRWNGDAHAVVDNIGKDGVVTGSYWSLDAAGTQLTLVAAGITGVPVWPLPVTVIYNTTGTAISCFGVASGVNITFSFYNMATGAPTDIAALVDTSKQFTIVMAYITSG